jgi:hypothetical protein
MSGSALSEAVRAVRRDIAVVSVESVMVIYSAVTVASPAAVRPTPRRAL